MDINRHYDYQAKISLLGKFSNFGYRIRKRKEIDIEKCSISDVRKLRWIHKPQSLRHSLSKTPVVSAENFEFLMNVRQLPVFIHTSKHKNLKSHSKMSLLLPEDQIFLKKSKEKTQKFKFDSKTCIKLPYFAKKSFSFASLTQKPRLSSTNFATQTDSPR